MLSVIILNVVAPLRIRYQGSIQRVPVPQDVPLMEEESDVMLGVVVVLDEHALPSGQFIDDHAVD